MNSKKVLIIGIDPSFIDFSSPEFAAFPNLTPQTIRDGINGSADQLNNLGYNAQVCWTDLGNTAIDVLSNYLKSGSFDVVVIGAGIRVPEQNFNLFERMINTIHEHAPKARICFNTKPGDTIAAVQRWADK